MALKWTSRAQSDLLRLHDFLKPVDTKAADRIALALIKGAERIPTHPRIGQQLHEFLPTEVRCLLVGDYEIRYAVEGDNIVILRLWHTREDR